VIFHCAGGASVARALAAPFDDFVRTVETSAAVLEYVRSAGSVPRLVFASSVSVYGSVGTDRATEERTPRPASPYAVHKLLAERLGIEYGRIFGVPGAIVRLPSVYGPGLRRQLLWDACRRLSAGEGTFSGSGRESRDWLHVADAAELLLAASDRATPAWPAVNGGTGTPATVEEVVRLAAETLGGPAPTFSGAARAGDPEHLVPDVSRALSWGWRPGTDWRAGVRAYCEWYRAGQR
jgi:UDP-glucose 4-epimerase